MLRVLQVKTAWLAAVCLAAGMAWVVSGHANRSRAIESPVTGQLLRGQTIVVDPGHGGRDSGAVGSQSREADINLAVALELRHWLRRAGAKVLMTWSRPDQLSKERNFRVTDRATWIQGTHADLLLDIHCNSGIAAHGPQVFYADGEASHLLAHLISQELHFFTHTHRQVERIKQYVLEHAGMPAVNVEVGFINHRGDEKLLMQPAYQRLLSWYILIGVERWYLRNRWPARLDDALPPAPMMHR